MFVGVFTKFEIVENVNVCYVKSSVRVTNQTKTFLKPNSHKKDESKIKMRSLIISATS